MQIFYDEYRFIREVLEEKEYKFLFKYPTVIDLGCNIGAFSLYIYDYADKIFAVDLAQDNITNLQKTIEVNKLNKIKPFCLAIAGDNKPREIIKNGSAGNGSWYLKNEAKDGAVPMTLCQFMDQEHIDYVDLLKMDVEGTETEIVLATDFPKGRIGTIIGENHTCGDPIAFMNALEGLGFRYKQFEDYHFIAKRV